MSGKQGSDPKKLAAAIIKIAAVEKPPRHFAAGSNAVEVITKKPDATRVELDPWRTLSSSPVIAA